VIPKVESEDERVSSVGESTRRRVEGNRSASTLLGVLSPRLCDDAADFTASMGWVELPGSAFSFTGSKLVRK
jgi:hypothetical protein